MTIDDPSSPSDREAINEVAFLRRRSTWIGYPILLCIVAGLIYLDHDTWWFAFAGAPFFPAAIASELGISDHGLGGAAVYSFVCIGYVWFTIELPRLSKAAFQTAVIVIVALSILGIHGCGRMIARCC